MIKAAKYAISDSKLRPLEDGDLSCETKPHREGHFILNAKKYDRPGLWKWENGQRQPLQLDEAKDLFRSGCYVVAHCSLFAYRTKQGVTGLSAGLEHIIFVRSGDPIGGGGISADKAFAELQIDESELEGTEVSEGVASVAQTEPVYDLDALL